MKPAQYATAVRLAAMILNTYGWTALSTFAHREHSTRKIDPGKITLYQFRKDVRALLLAGPTPTIPKEEDMPLTDAEIQSIASAVWFRDVSPGSEVNDPAWTTLWNIHKMLADPDALATAIVAKLPAGSLDKETVKQGVREVLLEGVGTP
jgi:hypothetical protein